MLSKHRKQSCSNCMYCHEITDCCTNVFSEHCGILSGKRYTINDCLEYEDIVGYLHPGDYHFNEQYPSDAP